MVAARAALGARLPARRFQLPEDPRRAHLLQTFIDQGNILTLDDPDLRCFPMAYMSEPGFWTMSDEEVAACAPTC